MKKIYQKKKMKLLNFLFLISMSIISAQQAQIKGSLKTVDTDRLYKIKVPNMIRSYSNRDISDFRIWDSKGDQVPYFRHTDDNETRISNFSEYKISTVSKIPDTSSTYIFRNPEKKIDKAVLLLANYQGNKHYSLQGSNDQKQWFGLVNNELLYTLNSATDISTYKVIQFPLCSYSYLKIVFDDLNSLPINLIKIGTATTELIRKEKDLIPVMRTTVSEIKDEKKTKIQIVFEHSEIIDEIYFDIAAPDLYNRIGTVYTLTEKEVNHKVKTYREEITGFTLRSDSKASFSIPSFFGKELYIEIENQDNPTLDITKIQFLQKPLYVVADLKEKETYTVSGGDLNLKAPQYDITYFRDRIPGDLPTSEIISLTLVEATTAKKKDVSFWQRPLFMWICIGFATVLVTYFASSLLKDMRKENV